MEEQNKLSAVQDFVSTLCINCYNLQSHVFTEFKCGCGCEEYIKVNMNVLDRKERKIFLITGPTGAGKNWLTKKLESINFENVPSLTTRAKREGEVVGVDYYFIDENQFEKLEAENKLCEKIVFGVDKYGVGKEILLNKLWKDTKNLIFIVEPNGLEQMIKWFNENAAMLKLLDIEISSIFLDIQRMERFLNLLGDAGLLDYNCNKLTFGISRVTNPDSFDISANASDTEFAENMNRIKDANGYLKALNKILDRFVRNGDNMDKEYYETIEKIKPVFNELNLKGIPCFRHIIDSKIKMNNFVFENKLIYNGVHNLLTDIQKVEDKELLTKLKSLIDEQIEKGE